MVSIPAKEIKRRGIAALDEALDSGPVQIIRRDEPAYVVLREEDFRRLLTDLAEARLAASEADVEAGRVKRTSAKKLIAEIG